MRALAGDAGASRRSPQGTPAAGIDPLLARAEQQVAGWRTISFRLPAAAEAPVVFTIDRGMGGEPHKRGTLTLNRPAAEIVRWEPFESLSQGRRLRTWLRFAHTGEVYGLVGQTIAGLLSFGGAVLMYTGLALALPAVSRLAGACAECSHALAVATGLTPQPRRVDRGPPGPRRPRRARRNTKKKVFLLRDLPGLRVFRGCICARGSCDRSRTPV